MPYRVEVSPTARQGFRRVPFAMHGRMQAAIDALADDPRPDGVVKTVGFAGRYRIRVGDYRVVYDILDDVLLVLVVRVGHRRNV